ncbi:MAG TPA: UbiX family flavin prenyltransferase [Firmicutes bacterium]|nr:UbiX family flavin prenyltransferase [Bacillota bacterium]
MTGASGAVYGIRMLEVLKEAGVETHLVVSKWAEETIKLETARTISEVRKLATHWYDESDLAAPISSGSLKSLGMVVVPCSVRTLSSIANGFSHNLIARAADVTLKERRRLVLVVRETPLSSIHLENMLRVTRAGAIVMPPNPAFYMKLASVDDLVDCFVGRVLDLFGVEHGLRCRWQAPLTRNEEPVEAQHGPE